MLLREKDKKTLLRIFSKSEEPIEVWAYGSRVNGNAHDGSDLDLVIKSKNERELPFKIYSGLMSQIQDSNIPILVDVKDWYLLPESFRKNILKNRVAIL